MNHWKLRSVLEDTAKFKKTRSMTVGKAAGYGETERREARGAKLEEGQTKPR